MTRVFISYSSAESALANRIREDLLDCGVQAWGFEIDGLPSVQYPDEIRTRLGEADFLCLVDSPAARRSSGVREECALATALQEAQGRPAFLVCCTAPGDEWKHPELFPKHNTLRHFDLHRTYDAIREVCLFLGVPYRTHYPLPRDQDFRDELANFSVDAREAQRLIDLYRRFQDHRCADRRFAEAYLTVLEAESACLAVKLRSPLLALAVLQGEGGQLAQAANTFQRVTEMAAWDPRGWAGLGGAWFYLDQFDKALENFRRAQEAFRAYPQADPHAYAQLVHNLASTLLVLGCGDEAERELDGLERALADRADVLILRAEMLISRQRHRDALSVLEQAAQHAADDVCFGPLVAFLSAECREAGGDWEAAERHLLTALAAFPSNAEVPRRLSRLYASRGFPGDAGQSVEMMKLARDLSRRTGSEGQAKLQYQAELALLLFRLGRSTDGRMEAKLATATAAATSVDHYYLGLSHYLLGQCEIAEAELARSRTDRKLTEWPRYELLL